VRGGDRNSCDRSDAFRLSGGGCSGFRDHAVPSSSWFFTSSR
jgi:hypothetical protein